MTAPPLAELLVAAPVIVPLAGFVVSVIAFRSVRTQRIVSLISSFTLLVVGAALVAATAQGDTPFVRMGDWPQPVAISFVADRFAATLVLIVGIIASVASVYAIGNVPRAAEKRGFHALMQTLFAAICGAFLTADIFNLYVWFEVMLMSSFVLLSLGGGRAAIEGAVKYVALNLLSSMLLLAAIGLTYGMFGTLNMAQLAERLAEAPDPAAFTPIAMIFLVAFGIKAGAFPFFFWLPASYHTPAPVTSAVFAGLLTKVGVYALVRFSSLMFPGSNPDANTFYAVLVWMAGLTMLVGVLGAAVQSNFRRIVAFHSVSQIGYMLMGLAIAGTAAAAIHSGKLSTDDASSLAAAATLALAGSVFFVIHHSIVKSNLFFVSGIVERVAGSGDIFHIGGLYKKRPYLSIVFMISAMSLAGLPISSGLWAKFLLVRAGLEAQAYGLVAVSLFVGSLTLYSMIKIWLNVFWAPHPDDAPPHDDAPRSADGHIAWPYAATALLAALTLAVGFAAGPVIAYTQDAADALLDTSEYRDTVLERNTQTPAEGDAPA